MAWRRAKPRPGSVVIVPEKDPSERKDYVAAAGAVAQIAASLVAIVALIVSTTRKSQ